MNNQKKIELTISTLQEFVNARTPWSQRKEIAAWSALLFYIAITLSIFNIEKNPLKDFQIPYALVMLIIVTFIFWRFIHAQYASIYYFIAQIEVIKNIRLELIDKENKFFEENGIENSNDINKLIDERIRDELESHTQKFIRKLHPVQILVFFWFYWIIKPVRRLCKMNPRKLGSIERMEAALYSLLFCVFLISAYFLNELGSIAK